ncbi:MAG: LuxR C-terminal-related transcriptional regulator [Phycisphaerales bacterium]
MIRHGGFQPGFDGARLKAPPTAPVSHSGKDVGFVIVEDHPLISFALGHVITAQQGWRLLAQTTCPTAARKVIETLRPRVIILDLIFRGASGMELLSWLSAAHPGVVPIVYSVQPEHTYARPCLRLGARGYVGKHEPVEVVVKTIELALGGTSAISGSPASPEDSRSEAPAAEPRLSARELEILELIGDGRSAREIAELLCRSLKTIETHRARIARKLQAHNSADLMMYAVRHRDARQAVSAADSPRTSTPTTRHQQPSTRVGDDHAPDDRR